MDFAFLHIPHQPQLVEAACFGLLALGYFLHFLAIVVECRVGNERTLLRLKMLGLSLMATSSVFLAVGYACKFMLLLAHGA